MPPKTFQLDDQLTLTVQKRANSRRIRLTILNDGTVKASIPKWVPYKAAVDFANKKLDWIKTTRPEPTILIEGRLVGKHHRLKFMPTAKDRLSTRIKTDQIVVFYPKQFETNSPEVQLAAKRAIRRALSAQAEHLLPIRLKELADKHGFDYNSVRIKSLKSRWGSCDSKANITLNLYLMDLPWNLIDYVLMHELNHTKVMQHGPLFWQELQTKLPNCLDLKKQLRLYPTTL